MEKSVCAFCDFSSHHMSVYNKKKCYMKEQAMRRTIKKMEDGDGQDKYDGPSGNEEGNSSAEEDAVNVMDEQFRTLKECFN